MAAAANGKTKLEQTARSASEERYVLRLFVSGLTGRSLRATRNIRRICEAHLPERYRLEVINIREHPNEAVNEQIIAAPTLVKLAPLPLRRMVGDLADEDRVLTSLGLKPSAAAST